ncbi:MAG TPA: D-alanine--D-alanine ligase [Candidatus Hydrogenedentes bacterium]|nr:D-alanine--D-alanine ligase [Candidatus Hydrogenedentota bacterium]HRT19208.1 D-alanine--D-alanine ligase [Candidatus Hydrogenedentota bacterium]HRT63288.1 D-alanine--D-alanine ligase [Candidatus Hydrogenedentota bacterium]
MNKVHVAVLMGGMSSEHEVSLVSGHNVAERLDRGAFDVTPVTILRDGRWSFSDGDPMDVFDAIRELKLRRVDCAFIALHGAYGEDGRIQGMLDMLGIPYTSSGCAGSGLAMDKLRSKAVAKQAGVPVAAHCTISAEQWRENPSVVIEQVQLELGFPCVIKSPCEGSSVGLAIPREPEAFAGSMNEVLKHGDIAMVEQYIRGTEVTCAVLDELPGRRPVALPVTEICPLASDFFDYHAKYTAGASEEITPARISPGLTQAVQEFAVTAHEAIGCAIWSRSDFIIGPDGPVWLEVNTTPGMTPTSLYPQAAAAAGISYSELAGRFVMAAIAWKRK